MSRTLNITIITIYYVLEPLTWSNIYKFEMLLLKKKYHMHARPGLLVMEFL